MLPNYCSHVLFLVFISQVLSAPTEPSLVITTQVPLLPRPNGETTPDKESTDKGESKAPVPPQIYQMNVNSKISNRFANTTIISKVKNVQDKAQEADFSVVLPETAFISGFIMEVGGKNYTAYVKEKEEAKKIYDNAVASGLGAAHVVANARDSNRFTVSTNIEPESKAAFYLTYEELLKRNDNKYELVINLHPGQPVKDMNVEVLISESRRITDVKTPPLRSGNEIGTDKQELDPRAEIHKINDTATWVKFSPNVEQQKQYAKELKTKEDEGFSGQFVVQYDVERDPQGGEVLVQDGYFVHFFAPSDLIPLPKHVVFVLDTSGSMYGDKIVQLREAMQKILGQLKPTDLFNLVEFNSFVKVWDLYSPEKSGFYPDTEYRYAKSERPLDNVTYPKAYGANADNVKKAQEIATKLEPDGGTDIYSALKVGLYLIELAQKDAKSENEHQPIIIFLTDGEPTVGETDTKKIINEITEFNTGPRKSPTFSLSFGYGADKNFLEKLALRNSGFNKHIYEAADASLQLQDFYKQISSPLLSDVTFKYEPSVTSLTVSEFPILFGGSELVVAGWCGTTTPRIEDTIVTGKGVKKQLIRFAPSISRAVSSTERLWAYLTIKQLLDKKETSDTEKDTLKKKALDIAIKYSFVTPVTSLVVVKPNETNAVDAEEAAKRNLPTYLLSAAPLASAYGVGLPGIPGPPAPNSSKFAGFHGAVGVRSHTLFRTVSRGHSRRRGRTRIAYTGSRSHSSSSSRIGGSSYSSATSFISSNRLAAAAPPSSQYTPLAFEADVDADRSVPDSVFTLTTTLSHLGTFTPPPPSPPPVSSTPAKTIFTELPWLSAIVDENQHITTKTGKFPLGLNETVTDKIECPQTPLNATGYCSLLKDCPQVYSKLSSADEYFNYFCPIKGFAGVCCPKDEP